MALKDFWDDVRSRNPLFRNPVSPPDAPRITADELDAELRNYPAAFGPRGPLRGYDEKEFDFLPAEDRAKLSGWVTQFNAVAPELRDQFLRAKTAEEQRQLEELIEQARVPLQHLILFFAHDRYLDAEAFRFGKLVEQELVGQLPEGVVELRFLAGEDSGGDPAIWVWAFLSDEATATDELLVNTGRTLRPILRAAARTAAPNHYPYILFRGASERVEEGVAA